MSFRDAVIRRVAFWAAVLTGAALVSLQFACDRPQTTPSSAGFPHAGRWPAQQKVTPTNEAIAEVDLANWWIQPVSPEKQSTQALIQKVNREGTGRAGTLEPIRNAQQPQEKPVPATLVQPAG